MKSRQKNTPARRSGFSLVEVLVVIAIIAVLGVVSLTISQRMRISAAKSTGVSQMREIGVAILAWTSENAVPEPFYASQGTEDFPNESQDNGEFRPGNPARLLYNKDDITQGHIQDFNTLFSPLSKLPGGAPTLKTYDPENASESRPWGTYTYHYPHATQDRMSPRQLNLGIAPVSSSSHSASGRLLLTEFYNTTWCQPKYSDQIHHALLVDGSVVFVADNDAAWTKWRTGQ